MPLNNRRVVEMLIEEVMKLEERCEGYHDLLTESLNDIAAAERAHLVQASHIQQTVNAKCDAAASYLAERSGNRTT